MYRCLYLFQMSLKYWIGRHGTRVSLALFPHLSVECCFGNEAINVLTLDGVLNPECHFMMII